MLHEEEWQEVASELPHYEDARALSLDALKAVQRRRGWVDDQALADCAEALGMSVAEMEGVATFYNLVFRQPVGRHVVLVCDSISCWICGYDCMREHLQHKLGIELGETTDDDRFTLLPVNCLGACDSAPAMMIDGELHRDLTPERIDAILGRYE
ncbi:MAG: NADH-quinone oxidoreductase subunit NuoE [Halofilum sp. (in: g-proteobacteria)]